MRRAAEIRSMEAIEELEGVPAKVKPEEIKLAKQVISNFEGELDLADYKDAYQEGCSGSSTPRSPARKWSRPRSRPRPRWST